MVTFFKTKPDQPLEDYRKGDCSRIEDHPILNTDRSLFPALKEKAQRIQLPFVWEEFSGVPSFLVHLLNEQGLHKNLCLSTPDSLSAAKSTLLQI